MGGEERGRGTGKVSWEGGGMTVGCDETWMQALGLRTKWHTVSGTQLMAHS